MPSPWIIPVKELRGRAGKSAHSKCEIGCIHSITRFVRKNQNDPSIQFHPDYLKQASQVYLVSFSLRSESSVCQDQQIYASADVALMSRCQALNRQSHNMVTLIDTTTCSDYQLSAAAFFIYFLPMKP